MSHASLLANGRLSNPNHPFKRGNPRSQAPAWERRPRSSASPPCVGCQPPSTVSGWADENTSPTRKRGVGIIPRLRVGLLLTPLVQLFAAISSGHFPSPLGGPAVLAGLKCQSLTGCGKRSFQSVRSQAGAWERVDSEKIKFLILIEKIANNFRIRERSSHFASNALQTISKLLPQKNRTGQ